MEEICQRFPFVAQKVLNHLDNDTLNNFKEAGRNNAGFLGKERFYWIRIIIHSFTGELREVWNKVVSKTPIETIKELAVAVQQFQMQRACRRCQEILRKCHKPPTSLLVTPFDCIRKLENQWHPLYIGAACGTVNLCKHIIQKTGVIEPWLKYGETPLHLAAMHGNLEVVRFFMANFVNSKRQETLLNRAVIGGQLDMCKLLIEEYKADVNLSDTNGRTPLHIASIFGHVEVCKFLCKHVMDKNTLDYNGKTPLDLAFSERNWEITRFQKISMEKIGTTFRFVHVGLKQTLNNKLPVWTIKPQSTYPVLQ